MVVVCARCEARAEVCRRHRNVLADGGDAAWWVCTSFAGRFVRKLYYRGRKAPMLARDLEAPRRPRGN
jgi:hypothetical protein